jgi:spore photoproduct lyase
MVPAESIAWVSLGSLRFSPDLLKVVRRRFPESAIFEHEFIRSRDGKLRYPRPLRLKLYKELKKMFSDFRAEEKLYLCMESTAVWNNFLEKNKRRRLFSAFPFPWLS